ncbi:MAG: hypothetical protein ACN6OP_26305 [Pseudomonadales bacterium]
MACHLAEARPDKRVGILGRRSAIGGTWDLFRYPGPAAQPSLPCRMRWCKCTDMSTWSSTMRAWRSVAPSRRSARLTSTG